MENSFEDICSSSTQTIDAAQAGLLGKQTLPRSQDVILSEEDEAARAIRNALASAIDRGDSSVRQFQAELCDSGALRQLYNLAMARRSLAFEALRLLAYRNRIVVQQLANMGAIDLLDQILVREARSGAVSGAVQAAALQLLTSLLAFNLEIHSLVMRTKLVKRLVTLCRPGSNDVGLNSHEVALQHDHHQRHQVQRQEEEVHGQSNGHCPGRLGWKQQGPEGDGAQAQGGSVAVAASAAAAGGDAQAVSKGDGSGSEAPPLLPGSSAPGANVQSAIRDVRVPACSSATTSDDSDGAGTAGCGSDDTARNGCKAALESTLLPQPQMDVGENISPRLSSLTNVLTGIGAGGDDAGALGSPAGAAHPDAPVVLSEEQQSMAACAAVALRNLCHQIANHPGLLSAGAALELAAVMQREPDPYRRINATMAVALLVGHEEQHPLMRMDEAGIREMLMVLACSRAKVMCHGYFWTCWKVCQALARLSANEDNKHILTREGGVEVLADVILSEEHSRKAITVKYCVEALWNLAFYEPARQQILGNSVLVEAIRAARQSGLDLVREVARGCLFTLGITDAGTWRSASQMHQHQHNNHHQNYQHQHNNHFRHYPHEPSGGFDPRDLQRVFSLAESTAATATAAVGAVGAGGLGGTSLADPFENPPPADAVLPQRHQHLHDRHQLQEHQRLRSVECTVTPACDGQQGLSMSVSVPPNPAAVGARGESGGGGGGNGYHKAAAINLRHSETNPQDCLPYRSSAEWHPPVLPCSPRPSHPSRPSQTSETDAGPYLSNGYAEAAHHHQQQHQYAPGDGPPTQLQRSNSGNSSRYRGSGSNGHPAQGTPDSPTSYSNSFSRGQGNGVPGCGASNGHGHGHAQYSYSHQNHFVQHYPHHPSLANNHSKSFATDLSSHGNGLMGQPILPLGSGGVGGNGEGPAHSMMHWQGVPAAGGGGGGPPGGVGESGHIMISYEWGSQQKALMIKEALERRGLQTWMDVEKMSGSTLEAMALAVEGATAVLLCITKRYKESQACRAEAEYAFQQRKRIIPIMMERGYRPTGWLGILVGTKLYFDFSERRLITERVAALERELGPLARLCRRPGSAMSAAPRSRPPSSHVGSNIVPNSQLHPHLYQPHGGSQLQVSSSSNHYHQNHNRTHSGARAGGHLGTSRPAPTAYAIDQRSELASPSLSCYQASRARRGSGASYVSPEMPYDIGTLPDALPAVAVASVAAEVAADSGANGPRYGRLPSRDSFARRDSAVGHCGGGGGGGSPSYRNVPTMLEPPSPEPSQIEDLESEASGVFGCRGGGGGSSGGGVDPMGPLSLPQLPSLPPIAPQLQPEKFTGATVKDLSGVLKPPTGPVAFGPAGHTTLAGPAAALLDGDTAAEAEAAAAAATVLGPGISVDSSSPPLPYPPGPHIMYNNVHQHDGQLTGRASHPPAHANAHSQGRPRDHGHAHAHKHASVRGVSHMHPDWRPPTPTPDPLVTCISAAVMVTSADDERRQPPNGVESQPMAAPAALELHVDCAKDGIAEELGNGNLGTATMLDPDPLLLHLPPAIGLQRLRDGAARAAALAWNVESGEHREGRDEDLSPPGESGTPQQFDPLRGLPFRSEYGESHHDLHRHHPHHRNKDSHIQVEQIVHQTQLQPHGQKRQQQQQRQQPDGEEGDDMASCIYETSCGVSFSADDANDTASAPSVVVPDPHALSRTAPTASVRWSGEDPGVAPSPPVRISRYRLLRDNTSTSLGLTSEYAASVFGGAAGAPSEEDSGLVADEPLVPPPLEITVSQLLNVPHAATEASIAVDSHVPGKVRAPSPSEGGHEAKKEVCVEVRCTAQGKDQEESKEEQQDNAAAVPGRAPSARHAFRRRNDGNAPAGGVLLHSISGGPLESVDGEALSTDGQSSATPQPGGSSGDLLDLPGGSNAAEQFVQALHPCASDTAAVSAAEALEKVLRSYSYSQPAGREGNHHPKQGEISSALPPPLPQQQGAEQVHASTHQPSKTTNEKGAAVIAVDVVTQALEVSSVQLQPVLPPPPPPPPRPQQQQLQPAANQIVGTSSLAVAAARSPFLTLLRPVTAALVSAAVALAPPSSGSRSGKLSVLERTDTVTAVPVPFAKVKNLQLEDRLSSMSSNIVGDAAQAGFGSPLASVLPPRGSTDGTGSACGAAPPAMAGGSDNARCNRMSMEVSGDGASAPTTANASTSGPPTGNGVASSSAAAANLATAAAPAASGLAALRLKAIMWASRRAAVDSAVVASRTDTSARTSSAGGVEPMAPAAMLPAPTGVDGDADDLVGERLAMAMDSGSRINRSRQSMDLASAARVAASRSRQSIDLASISRGIPGERGGSSIRSYGHLHGPPPPGPSHAGMRNPLENSRVRPGVGGPGLSAGGGGSEAALSAGRVECEANENMVQIEEANFGELMRRSGSSSVGGAPGAPPQLFRVASRRSAGPQGTGEVGGNLGGAGRVSIDSGGGPSSELRLSARWSRHTQNNDWDHLAAALGSGPGDGPGVGSGPRACDCAVRLDISLHPSQQRLRRRNSLVPEEEEEELGNGGGLFTGQPSGLDTRGNCGPGGALAQPATARSPEEDLTCENFVSQSLSPGLEMEMGMGMGMTEPLELSMQMGAETEMAVPPSSTSQLVERWKAPQVRDWLVRIGHGGLADRFEELNITGRALCGLMRVMRGGGGATVVRDMLRHELGVTGLAAQLELLEELHRLFD